jgi:hypothetical protein
MGTSPFENNVKGLLLCLESFESSMFALLVLQNNNQVPGSRSFLMRLRR